MINDSWGPFDFTQEGFRWKRSDYKFTDILHLFFKRVVTQHSVNFVNTIKTEGAGFRIILADGGKIDLTHNDAKWQSTNYAEMTAALTELYLHFARITFARRLKFYEEQITRRGYYEYEGFQFYPRDKIVFKGDAFPMASSTLHRSAGLMEIRKSNYGFANKILKQIPFASIPQFDTLVDSDVLFHLFEHKFGLVWKN